MASPRVDPAVLRKLGADTLDLIANHFSKLKAAPVKPVKMPGDIALQFEAEAPQTPRDFSTILKSIDEKVIPGITHWQHPRFMAYYPSSSSIPAILAEAVITALGVVGLQWSASPAVTELEVVVMDWVAKMFGVGGDFLHTSGKGGGIIQNTASDALAAIMIAARVNKHKQLLGDIPRDELFYADSSKLVAYMSDHTHFSSPKAARCAGVRIHQIPAKLLPNGNYGITACDVRKAMEEDRAKGLEPFIVILNHGSTNTCGYDDVTGMDELGLWVHVDAAYAGASWILPEFQERAQAVAKVATSFNVNASKWFLCGFDSAMLWVRDRNLLKEVFSATDKFMDNKDELGCYDPEFKDWSFPLGRKFRSLRLWMVIEYFGVSGLQDYLRNGIAQATWMREQIEATPGFSQPVATDLGLVIVAVQDNEGKDITSKVAERLLPSFLVYPSSLCGSPIIRLAFGSVHTETEDLKELFRLLVESREAVMKEEPANGN